MSKNVIKLKTAKREVLKIYPTVMVTTAELFDLKSTTIVFMVAHNLDYG